MTGNAEELACQNKDLFDKLKWGIRTYEDKLQGQRSHSSMIVQDTLNYWAFSVPSLGHELVGLHLCPDPLLHSAILSSFSTPPIIDLKEGVSR